MTSDERQTHADSGARASASLLASKTILRAQDPRPTVHYLGGAAMPNSMMQDSVLSALLTKLLPAGIGAAIMIAVDMPATKRELFMRVFVAMACSIVFGEALFDYLDANWLPFLDTGKHMHHAAVNAVLGGSGWFIMGAAAMLLKKFRGDPVAAAKELRP